MNGKRFVSIARQFWGHAPAMVTGCVLGLVAGLAAVVFHWVIHFLFEISIEATSKMGLIPFAAVTLIIMMTCGLISGWLLAKFAPEAAGSGIPQLKISFWKDFGYVPSKIVVVKFIAGALSIGSGLSLGREGPTVQLAGGLASWLSGWLGVVKQKRRTACAAGAAAGLAAAFKTPLAAITFVLEEIISDMNSRFLSGVLLASVVGALVTYAILGKAPVFEIQAVEEVSWIAYLATPVVAILTAMVGVAFQKLTLSIRTKCKGDGWLPVWMRPSLGAFSTWLFGLTIFLMFGKLGVFGMGYPDLSKALEGDVLWYVAIAFVVAKLLATACAYGTGGCGGIFAPTLFLGGMAGAGLAALLGQAIHLDQDDFTVLAVVGMCACFGAVVGAPITAILIIFEMTHEFLLIPPLMVATVFSQIVSRYLLKYHFYEEVLEQDGHDMRQIVPPRDLRQWQQRPVGTAASFNLVTVTDLQRETLEQIFAASPYNRFPVVIDGKVKGILRRHEALAAFREGRDPVVLPTTWVSSRSTLGESQKKLIEASCDLAVVGEEDSHQLVGVITLHDLMRDQQALLLRSE